MKYHQCNKKAKEAWGKCLVDLSLHIARGIISLMVFGPIAYLYKNGTDGVSGSQSISMHHRIMEDAIIGFSIISLIAVAVILAIYFQRTGIRYIHESDADSGATPQEADPLKADK